MSTSIGSAAQAESFLESLVLAEPRAYAERAAHAQRAVSALLEQLGDPHRSLRVVHITGSKGKGSTALLLEAILRAAGLRVGTFISPHLSHWRERFRLGGAPIAEQDFATLVAAVQPAVGRLLAGPGATRPSFFDTATAAALLFFRRADVDVAIIEVGLGGRLDATNVVEPQVCCLTSVELEHTDKLGHTLAAIATEKAGIIKPGITTVCGPLPPEAARVVEARASAVAAPLMRLDREFQVTARALQFGYQLDYREPRCQLTCSLPLAGHHQTINAALAVACASRLGIAGLPDAVHRGLSTVNLPGRCELLRRRPWIVVDSAHTTESGRALRQVVDRLPAERRHWLFSFTQGKDPCAIAAQLLRPGDSVTITRADPQRSQPPVQVAARLGAWSSKRTVRCVDDPRQALRQACAELTSRDLLAVTGSVYLAGLGRSMLGATTAMDSERAA